MMDENLAELLQDEVSTLRLKVAALQDELDTERMRLAACGVVALANTPESAAQARQMKDEYRSASCDDVARLVDSEMALRHELAREKERADLGWQTAGINDRARQEEMAKRDALAAVIVKQGEMLSYRGLVCGVAPDQVDAILAAHDDAIRAGFVQQLQIAQKEIEELKVAKLRRFKNEDCWIYDGDDAAFESLICPIVITKEQIAARDAKVRAQALRDASNAIAIMPGVPFFALAELNRLADAIEKEAGNG